MVRHGQTFLRAARSAKRAARVPSALSYARTCHSRWARRPTRPKIGSTLLGVSEAIMQALFNPLDHPDAEVSRRYFCLLTGRSRITAYRNERSNPDWPKPIVRGNRVFYKAVDHSVATRFQHFFQNRLRRTIRSSANRCASSRKAALAHVPCANKGSRSLPPKIIVPLFGDAFCSAWVRAPGPAGVPCVTPWRRCGVLAVAICGSRTCVHFNPA